MGESNLLNRIFKIIKATTDEERMTIAEGSEILMDVVTQIRKFLYDEETKEMKNIQDKWKYEARKEGRTEGLAEGIEQGIEQGQLNIIYYNVPISVDTIRRRYPIKWTYQEGVESLIVDTKIWVF